MFDYLREQSFFLLSRDFQFRPILNFTYLTLLVVYIINKYSKSQPLLLEQTMARGKHRISGLMNKNFFSLFQCAEPFLRMPYSRTTNVYYLFMCLTLCYHAVHCSFVKSKLKNYACIEICILTMNTTKMYLYLLLILCGRLIIPVLLLKFTIFEETVILNLCFMLKFVLKFNRFIWNSKFKLIIINIMWCKAIVNEITNYQYKTEHAVQRKFKRLKQCSCQGKRTLIWEISR